MSFRTKHSYLDPCRNCHSTANKPNDEIRDAKCHKKNLFLGTSLDSSLGDLALLVRLLNRLDDTDSNSLSHVTDSETTKRRIVSEGLNTHRLGWNHLNDGSITGLDELGSVLNGFTSTTVNLLQDFRELAGNVGSVAVKHWGVTSTN